MSPVTRKHIDAILPFLEQFEETGFSVDPYDEAVVEFVQILYANDWVTPRVKWVEWQDVAEEYVDSPEKIKSADVVTVQRLFTTHVRKDRFCEGHLSSMVENGHIVALLRRLKEILETTPDTAEWNMDDAAWEEGFGYLTAYVQAEGHARVPQRHRTADGFRLGAWVAKQRYKKDTLSADRRQRLDAVDGWVWNARPSKHGRKKP